MEFKEFGTHVSAVEVKFIKLFRTIDISSIAFICHLSNCDQRIMIKPLRNVTQ